MGRRMLFLALLCCLADGTWAQDPAKKEDPKPIDTATGTTLPIKAFKRIQFTTDEATWMSLDLSPDGKTIVFDLVGDIYLMPAEGGEAKRLIGGASHETMPKFSPDGKKLVFISDRSGAENVWICNLDGGEMKALTKDRETRYLSPSFTPDGKGLVVSRALKYLAPYDLRYIDLRTNNVGDLGTPTPGINRMGAVFSSDGQYAYYAERSGSWSYDAKFPMWQIQRLDLRKGIVQQITNASGSAVRPMLSRDGKLMYYATRRGQATVLRSRDLKTGAEKVILPSMDRDEQESRATRDLIAAYAITPDNRYFIMPKDGKIKRIEIATGAETVIPFSAKVDAEVNRSCHFEYSVDESPTVLSRLAGDPSLSPDNKKVVFTAFQKIWVANADGTNARRLTILDTSEFQPRWSPDGSKIAFTTFSQEAGHLYVVSADGGTPKALTEDANAYYEVVWTPDGKRIVYESLPTDDWLAMSVLQPTHTCLDPNNATNPEADREIGANFGMFGNIELRIVNADGTEPRIIGPAMGAGNLHFAKDPNRLYYQAGNSIRSMTLDGIDRKVVLSVSGPGVGEMKVSPDGDRVFLEQKNKLYIAEVPYTGTAAPTINGLEGGALSPVKKVSAGEGGNNLRWSADGKSVTWGMGVKFYTMNADDKEPKSVELKAEVPRYKAKGTVLLRGGKVITMKGRQILEKGDILIVDSRIQAVGPTGSLNVPAGAKVFDLKGKTVMPGWVDVHSHWFGLPIDVPQSWGYLANLAYGVTTNRDPQSGSTDIYDRADAIESGEAIGPRIYTTGPGIFSSNEFGSLDEVKNYLKRYRDAYKTRYIKQYVAGDRMVRQWILQACQEYGITPTTEGALDVKQGMTEMADGYSGHEHSLPVTPLYKDLAEFIAGTQTYYTPTMLVAYGGPTTENYWFENTDVAHDAKLRRFVPPLTLDGMVNRRTTWNRPEEYHFSKIAQACNRVLQAGGRVCLGSHGQLQGLGAHWDVWSMASGMSNFDALRCASINGAEALGLSKDIGSIEPGKLADILVMDGDPLVDIRNTNTLRYVMKGGQMWNADTMDEVWPQPKKLPSYYWVKY